MASLFDKAAPGRLYFSLIIIFPFAENYIPSVDLQ